MLIGVQIFNFLKLQKYKKNSKNSKILKNYGHFWIPHPQISLKQYSKICKIVVYFFGLCRGGGKVSEDFRKAIQFLEIKNWSVSVLFDILQLPHSVFLHSEKLTHPTVQHT